MREQFFIDILVMILKETVTKNELEMYAANKANHSFQENFGTMFSHETADMVITNTNINTNTETVESKGPMLGEYAKQQLKLTSISIFY